MLALHGKSDLALFSALTSAPQDLVMEDSKNESWNQNQISQDVHEELSDFIGDGLGSDSEKNLIMDEFGLDFNVTSVLEG